MTIPFHSIPEKFQRTKPPISATISHDLALWITKILAKAVKPGKVICYQQLWKRINPYAFNVTQSVFRTQQNETILLTQRMQYCFDLLLLRYDSRTWRYPYIFLLINTNTEWYTRRGVQINILWNYNHDEPKKSLTHKRE